MAARPVRAIWRLLTFGAMLGILAACKVDAETTLYVRDLREAAAGELLVPVTLTTYAPGASEPDTCQKMEEFVPLLTQYVANARLEACIERPGAMEDAVIFAAEIPMRATRAPEETLAVLVTPAAQDHMTYSVGMSADPARIERLVAGLRRVNMMATVDLDDVSVTLKLINDLREPVTVSLANAFFDRRPIDSGGSTVELEPRRESDLALSDVKSLYLLTQGETSVFDVRFAQ